MTSTVNKNRRKGEQGISRNKPKLRKKDCDLCGYKNKGNKITQHGVNHLKVIIGEINL